ncbi:unnamed protein product [Amoebophrya sp. A25]|nr:unnamed protein product [Amoebophrya sp. A25]|eukprot:GSA25T00000906001.1
MKFGAILTRSRVPEWSQHYLDYNQAKNILKECLRKHKQYRQFLARSGQQSSRDVAVARGRFAGGRDDVYLPDAEKDKDLEAGYDAENGKEGRDSGSSSDEEGEGENTRRKLEEYLAENEENIDILYYFLEPFYQFMGEQCLKVDKHYIRTMSSLANRLEELSREAMQASAEAAPREVTKTNTLSIASSAPPDLFSEIKREESKNMTEVGQDLDLDSAKNKLDDLAHQSGSGVVGRTSQKVLQEGVALTEEAASIRRLSDVAHGLAASLANEIQYEAEDHGESLPRDVEGVVRDLSKDLPGENFAGLHKASEKTEVRKTRAFMEAVFHAAHHDQPESSSATEETNRRSMEYILATGPEGVGADKTSVFNTGQQHSNMLSSAAQVARRSRTIGAGVRSDLEEHLVPKGPEDSRGSLPDLGVADEDFSPGIHGQRPGGDEVATGSSFGAPLVAESSFSSLAAGVADSAEKSLQVDDWQKKLSTASGEAPSGSAGRGVSKSRRAQVDLVLFRIMKEINKLEDFCRLNYSGYRKIMKKHDKKTTLQTLSVVLPFLAENYIFPNYQTRLKSLSDQVKMLAETMGGVSVEDYWKFQTGESSSAASEMYILAFFLGVVLMALIDLVVMVEIPATNPEFDVGAFFDVFPLFRFSFMFILVLWMLGWVTSLYEKYSINYIFLLDIDPKCQVRAGDFFGYASIHTMVWIIFFGFYIYICKFSPPAHLYEVQKTLIPLKEMSLEEQERSSRTGNVLKMKERPDLYFGERSILPLDDADFVHLLAPEQRGHDPFSGGDVVVHMTTLSPEGASPFIRLGQQYYQLLPFGVLFFQIIFLFFPSDVFRRRYRTQILSLVGDVITANPWVTVTFGANIVGDILTSFVKPLSDLQYTACYLTSAPPEQGSEAVQTSAERAADGFLQQGHKAQCNDLEKWLAPFILALPYWFRLMQCVARLRAAREGERKDLEAQRSYAKEMLQNIDPELLLKPPGESADNNRLGTSVGHDNLGDMKELQLGNDGDMLGSLRARSSKTDDSGNERAHSAVFDEAGHHLHANRQHASLLDIGGIEEATSDSTATGWGGRIFFPGTPSGGHMVTPGGLLGAASNVFRGDLQQQTGSLGNMKTRMLPRSVSVTQAVTDKSGKLGETSDDHENEAEVRRAVRVEDPRGRRRDSCVGDATKINMMLPTGSSAASAISRRGAFALQRATTAATFDTQKQMVDQAVSGSILDHPSVLGNPSSDLPGSKAATFLANFFGGSSDQSGAIGATFDLRTSRGRSGEAEDVSDSEPKPRFPKRGRVSSNRTRSTGFNTLGDTSTTRIELPALTREHSGGRSNSREIIPTITATKLSNIDEDVKGEAEASPSKNPNPVQRDGESQTKSMPVGHAKRQSFARRAASFPVARPDLDPSDEENNSPKAEAVRWSEEQLEAMSGAAPNGSAAAAAAKGDGTSTTGMPHIPSASTTAPAADASGASSSASSTRRGVANQDGEEVQDREEVLPTSGNPSTAAHEIIDLIEGSPRGSQILSSETSLQQEHQRAPAEIEELQRMLHARASPLWQSPHLWNAVKYLSGILVVFQTTFTSKRWVWALISLSSTGYMLTWDILMDWNLLWNPIPYFKRQLRRLPKFLLTKLFPKELTKMSWRAAKSVRSLGRRMRSVVFKTTRKSGPENDKRSALPSADVDDHDSKGISADAEKRMSKNDNVQIHEKQTKRTAHFSSSDEGNIFGSTKDSRTKQDSAATGAGAGIVVSKEHALYGNFKESRETPLLSEIREVSFAEAQPEPTSVSSTTSTNDNDRREKFKKFSMTTTFSDTDDEDELAARVKHITSTSVSVFKVQRKTGGAAFLRARGAGSQDPITSSEPRLSGEGTTKQDENKSPKGQEVNNKRAGSMEAAMNVSPKSEVVIGSGASTTTSKSKVGFNNTASASGEASDSTPPSPSTGTKVVPSQGPPDADEQDDVGDTTSGTLVRDRKVLGDDDGKEQVEHAGSSNQNELKQLKRSGSSNGQHGPMASYQQLLEADSGTFDRSYGTPVDESVAPGRQKMLPDYFYIIVPILNFFLRFTWILTIIPTPRFFLCGDEKDEASLCPAALSSNLIVFLAAAGEIYRRGQWALLRLENEHLTNASKFRAFCWVPPMYQADATGEK